MASALLTSSGPATALTMELKFYLVILAPAALLLLFRLYHYSKLSARPSRFPPGPKTLPFLGNLHQIPISRPELKFADFARQFGPLTGLKIGSQNMVVLNTWQAVRDLIEQKGSIYSSRPTLPVFDVVVPGGLNPALNVYGELWRRQRKVLVEFLGGDHTDRVKPVQDAESTQMIYDMMCNPLKFEDYISRSFGAVIMATVFGQRGKTIEPGGKISHFFKVAEEWAAAVGPTSSPPITTFPFLEMVPDWLTPWRGWRKRALGVKKEQERMYLGLLTETRERLAQGRGVDCYMAQCLNAQEKEWYGDIELAYLGGVLLEAGAETSASTAMVFVLAMAAFPEVLKQAQEEVDRVCGTLKMPNKDDINKLPYVRACMLEVLRWRPVGPLAIPHQTTADDTYQGFTVPAGTDVVINTWRINHDESFYNMPSQFDPSRYMTNDSSNASTSAEPDAAKGRQPNYSFGAGRRICPGQRFAENSLMMHFAKLAWAFDIEPTGPLPVDTWEGWTEGLVTKPKGLNVRLKLRDEGRRKIIDGAYMEADAFLRQFED